MDSFVEGFKMMIPAIAILIFAWSLKGNGRCPGDQHLCKNIVGNNASASVILPQFICCCSVPCVFYRNKLGNFAILVPIAITMFPGSEECADDDHCCVNNSSGRGSLQEIIFHRFRIQRLCLRQERSLIILIM